MGVEGGEQEESTPNPVAAGTEKYVYFSNLPVPAEGCLTHKIFKITSDSYST